MPIRLLVLFALVPARAAPPAQLADAGLELTFDQTTGELIAMRRPGGPSAIASPGGVPFQLTLHDRAAGRLRPIPDEAVVPRGVVVEGDRATLRYALQTDGGNLTVEVTIALDGGGYSVWWLGLTNDTDLDLTGVEFPRLRNLALGGDGRDDALLWPYWRAAGQRYRNPSTVPALLGMSGGGRGFFHWLELYDETNGGLYLAAEDPEWLSGPLTVAGNPDRGTVDLALGKLPRVRPGEAWLSPPFRVGLHEGDWHSGADRYRAWVESQVEYDPPRWAVESDGWLGKGRGTAFGPEIAAAFRQTRELGLDHLQVWGQMTVGLGVEASCCNRLYYPDPLQGGEAELAAAVKAVRAAGGHIGFYTNGQAWNPRYPRLRPEYEGKIPPEVELPDWNAGFQRNGVVRADGAYVPQYTPPPNDPYPGKFMLMNPAAAGWRGYLRHWLVDKYARDYQVDIMYLDQMGAAPAQPDYANDADRRQVGVWQQGYLKLLEEVKSGARAAEPEFALATEGFGDVYGRYVDLFLVSPEATWDSPERFPELLRYTLPDRILVDGFANGFASEMDPKDVLDRIFLLGNRFDYWPQNGPTDAYFAQLLRLRQEVGPILYRATFRDDLGLSVDGDGIEAKWWRYQGEFGDGAVVTARNTGGRPGTVSLPAELIGEQVLAATLGQPLRAIEPRRMEGRVTLDIPPERVAVWLVGSFRGELLRLPPIKLTRGGDDTIEVRYRPLTGMVGAGKLTLVAPGWPCEPVTFDAAEPTDATLRVRVPQDPPAAVPVRVRVELPDGVRELDGTALVVSPAGELTGWRRQRYEGEVTAEVETTAAGSVLALTTTARGDRGAWQWRSAELPEGSSWRLTGEVRTEGIAGEGARVRVIFPRRDDPREGTRPPLYTEFLTGTHDWTPFDLTFDVPPNTGQVQVELFHWHAAGRSWWRGLRLEPEPQIR